MKDRRENGSVTVYFSFVAVLLIALIAAMLESARFTAFRVRLPQAAETAAESLLACYDTELFNQYGLIYYRDSNPIVTDLLLNGYFQPEADADIGRGLKHVQLLRISKPDIGIVSKKRATDNGGEDFVRQILELMKFQGVVELTQTLSDMVNGKKNADEMLDMADKGQDDYENTDWQQKADENSTEAADDVNQTVGQTVDGSIIGFIEDLLGQAILKVVLPGKDISPKNVNNINWWEMDEGIEDRLSFEEQVLFGEYVLSYFGNVLQPSHGCMEYEQEYILNGYSSDSLNLSMTLAYMLSIRSGMNLISIISYKELSNQAKAVAELLVGWLGIPGLSSIVEVLAAAAWAAGEGFLDVRALVKGKKIPFFKKSIEFTSSMASCVGLITGGEMAKEKKGGIGYEMYIRMLLITLGKGVVRRTMQMMELNLRQSDKLFTFDSLTYGFKVRAEGEMIPVFGTAYKNLHKGIDRLRLSTELEVEY